METLLISSCAFLFFRVNWEPRRFTERWSELRLICEQNPFSTPCSCGAPHLAWRSRGGCLDEPANALIGPIFVTSFFIEKTHITSVVCLVVGKIPKKTFFFISWLDSNSEPLACCRVGQPTRLWVSLTSSQDHRQSMHLHFARCNERALKCCTDDDGDGDGDGDG